MQHAVVEGVGVREDRVRLRRVANIFLQAEVGDRHVEVQGRGHGHWRQVGGAVATGLDVVQVGEGGDLLQVGDAAGVQHGGAQVVDQLLFDQLLGVPDVGEDLADGQ